MEAYLFEVLIMLVVFITSIFGYIGKYIISAIGKLTTTVNDLVTNVAVLAEKVNDNEETIVNIKKFIYENGRKK